ncbi:peptide/nickel transport system substrate-binding protein [Nocardioides albertanoniae]|uniref:Peptide/nickel transport system substrate-binding protein n=1 Tax=Nocardioides albertanoniae TaxID=1175486 RepID=A0A543A606_9ACTN|nr:ABC transporter substrate-binding protein [Nocardioides albertanoniae]TQL67998.1 peptide/nickel transport system substrate-binding protein [Nocardioides albertanoniae]
MSAQRRHGQRTIATGATAVAVTLLAAGLAGCGSGGGSAADPNGTLVFGISADPAQMVPWTATSTQSIQVLSQIYSPLLNTDAEGVPEAGLAELPKISDDGRTYTFTLRDGVTFSDGSALDSADVKSTYERIMDPASSASSASYFASVAEIKTPDPQTVEVILKQPDASFDSGLTAVNTAIVPSDADPKALETEPIGSGPYQFKSRTPNESITLTRNADYYAGKPGSAKVEFRVIPDEQSMVSSLKTGSVDVAIFDNPVTAKSATSGKTESTTVDSLSYHVLQLRATSPTLKDRNARLAIQCAVSREDVIDSAALGSGKPTGPITSPEFRSDADAQPCPEQDLAKAKDYLAKAGKPDGFELNLMTSQGLYSTAVDEAQNIQAQLGKVGIKVKVEALDSNAYVERWLASDFDAAIAMNGGSSDPNTMYGRYFTKAGSFNKVAGYSSPELDKLFADGIATTDVAARKPIYQEISQQLVDQAAWVWLFTPELYVVADKGVEGLEKRTDASISTLWKASVS